MTDKPFTYRGARTGRLTARLASAEPVAHELPGTLAAAIEAAKSRRPSVGLADFSAIERRIVYGLDLAGRKDCTAIAALDPVTGKLIDGVRYRLHVVPAAAMFDSDSTEVIALVAHDDAAKINRLISWVQVAAVLARYVPEGMHLVSYERA